MAGLIDAIYSYAWYWDHLHPIMDALGPAAGQVIDVSDPRVRRDRRPAKPERIALIASYGDLIRARLRGYKRLVLTQHGAGQSYGGDRKSIDAHSYPGGRSHGDVGLFLVPNEHGANRWRKAYPKIPVRVVGCPKLDSLPAREPGEAPVVAVSFHWEYGLVPETRSAFPEYAGAVTELAKHYRVIGHAHPRRTDLRRFWTRLGVEQVREFADVCRRADLYVVDNSSTLFEFAATGRPVVVVNSREYRRDVCHGLRFWDAASVGVQVDARAGLLPAVERALELRPEDVEAREKALSLVYQPRTGGAALAAKALLDWA